MAAFLFIIIIGNQACFIGIYGSGAVLREKFNSELRIDRNRNGSFWLFVSGIGEWVIVTWENTISNNASWIRLCIDLNTSGNHVLSPNLGRTATLSVVEIC
jgi:hypothetical protein